MKIGVMPSTMITMGTPKRQSRSSTKRPGPFLSRLPGWK